MSDCQHWYCGLAPHTPMERSQAETEAMYEREDRWSREGFTPVDLMFMSGDMSTQNAQGSPGRTRLGCNRLVMPVFGEEVRDD